MIRVLLEAPILTKSGYGEHSRLVYKALSERKDLEIMINPLRWGNTTFDLPDGDILTSIQSFGSYIQACKANQTNPEFNIQVHVGIPNEFEKKAPYSVCVTAGIETDRVDANWLLKTHQGIDKIIVPSQHARDGFVRTKYEVFNKTQNTKSLISCACPVDVIPYPVKNPDDATLDIDFSTNFNFLTVALIGPRKNLETTIRGFIEEFRDEEDVGLILKTSLARNSIMDRANTLNSINSIVKSCGKKKCKIYLVHGDLTESELHSLYVHPKIKAYVSTTHGEGYGLPIFEAAYSGMPIIATDWSGHLDFLSGNLKGKNKKLFARVDYDLKQVQENVVWENIITEDSKWAYPKEVSYKTKLRKVYNNYGMYKKWATELKEKILETHKLEKILEQYNVSIFGTPQESKKETIQELKTQALQISNIKERAKFAKEIVMGDISQNEKIEFLKDMFKGEKAYVLSCGPTLTDHNKEEINKLLRNNLAVAIKQSYDLFSGLVDFHIYNCANFKKYDYIDSKPIVIEAATTPYRLGDCDVKFFIRERDFDKSVAASHDFGSWTFDKQPLLRPYGPGIMYEVVFYALQHLGVSEMITIGWDNKLVEGNADQQHFYDKKDSNLNKEDFIHSNEVAANQSAVDSLDHEAKITTDAMLAWHEWLNSKGTALKIVSSINPAPPQIERIEI
tara:strand:+ start:15342 stop:17372 length:2031 start_codon:yes stop_codon:yes gene_type:complete